MKPWILAKALVSKNIPVYVHYGITHRCNLRCKMCGVWKTGNRETELTPSQIQRMAKVLSHLGTQVISIGGGEPLVREDLPQCLSFFLEEGIRVRLLSNGVLVSKERLQKVVDLGVKDFSVSLDTLKPSLLEDIINRKGGFNEVMNSLEFISHILKKKKGLGLINTVVSSANLDELPNIVKFAKKMGFFVSFIPLEIHEFSGKVLGCTETMADMTYTPEDRQKAKEVIPHLIEMKEKGEPIFNSTPFLKEMEKYISGEKFQWKCLAGSLYFSISPEGNFSICHKYLGYTEKGIKISVLDENFENLFKSPDYVDSVKRIQKECMACLRPCWAEVSFLFTNWHAMWEMMKIQLNKIF